MTKTGSWNFDQRVDRSASDSIKWRRYRGRDVIPLWVADMDFPAAPPIQRALEERVAHGIFGYPQPPGELAETIAARVERHYGWKIDPSWVVFGTGGVSGLNIAVRAYTPLNGTVITTVPIYRHFLLAPKLADRSISRVPMKEVSGRWLPDLSDSGELAAAAGELLLLCNPHNPCGTVFTRPELERIAEGALRKGWVICSDEVHCDLLLDEGAEHVPIASLSPEVSRSTVTLFSPAKAFNIPGLGFAFAIIENEELRRRWNATAAGIVPEINLFAFTASIAAYSECDAWLQDLRSYLRGNRDLLTSAFADLAPLRMFKPEATFLAWINLSDSGLDSDALERHGVGVMSGDIFSGSGFVRLNFGCPRSVLQEALSRISTALRSR